MTKEEILAMIDRDQARLRAAPGHSGRPAPAAPRELAPTQRDEIATVTAIIPAPEGESVSACSARLGAIRAASVLGDALRRGRPQYETRSA